MTSTETPATHDVCPVWGNLGHNWILLRCTWRFWRLYRVCAACDYRERWQDYVE